MIKVNNKTAILNIANKSFKANKTRNLIVIIGISLIATLFTILFTMGIITMDSLQQAHLKKAGGKFHGVLQNITKEQFNKIKTHPLIKEIAYTQVLADKVENIELIQRHTYFTYYDDVALNLRFINLKEGHIPNKANEVIVDTKTLKLLDIPPKIGSPVNLSLNIKGDTVVKEFDLCGFWESDFRYNIGQIITSKAYIDTNKETLNNVYSKNNFKFDNITALIMFDNSFNLEDKLAKVITSSGFSMIKTQPNYVGSSVNLAYLSINFDMDIKTLIGLILVLLLIILIGYLVIYNIFQISILYDIRFYGLLKTIGTTGKQIRNIILRQVILLLIIGIPIGLFLGYFIGNELVPLLMQSTAYADSSVIVSPNPIIFLSSMVLTLITVFVSTLKSTKIATTVSPVETMSYTYTSTSKRLHKTTHGAKISQMAKAYILSNKKHTTFVVVSMSLSLIFLNTFFTLSYSLDVDKFINKYVDTDFIIAHEDYFNETFYRHGNQVSEKLINTIELKDGFNDGGSLYNKELAMFAVTDKNNTSTHNLNAHGDSYASCYGLDDFPLNILELHDGELDKEKLLSGKYILEGIGLDDNSNPYWDSANFKVGEKITLHNYKKASGNLADKEYINTEFTVLGHVSLKYNAIPYSSRYTFYLPINVYKSIVSDPTEMNYMFNVSENAESTFEEFLKNYTTKTEFLMDYNSKATRFKSFISAQNTILIIGVILVVIIGLIGVLNFINSILTSIISRRGEFAILQSIGMTRKQLSQMLCYEGLYYTIFTGVTSIIFGVTCSLVIVKTLCENLWFMSYHFIMWPLLIPIPLLIIFGVIVPIILLKSTYNKCVVDQLK